MLPGCAGVELTVAVSDRAALLPQLLLAVTVIAPPADPAVAEILFVDDEPVHPPGSVHV